MKKPKSAALIWLWPVSIATIWLIVAWQLRQLLWAQQSSRDLLDFGVFRGGDLSVEGSWRLIASQWLHVKPQHMILNAVVIGLVGQALQSRASLRVTLVVGIIGGAIGQVASAVAYPESFISGASQAEFALCGAALVMLRLRDWGWTVAAIGIGIGIALDLVFSQHWGIKAGHLAGLVVGICAGGYVVIRQRRFSFAADRLEPSPSHLLKNAGGPLPLP